MRKHTVLPANTTFPRVPIAMKELEIATPIMDNLAETRCHQIHARDHIKSTGNIYSDINASKNDSEESDTSSLYHEPYRRIPVSKHEYSHTNRKEARKNNEYSSRLIYEYNMYVH